MLSRILLLSSTVMLPASTSSLLLLRLMLLSLNRLRSDTTVREDALNSVLALSKGVVATRYTSSDFERREVGRSGRRGGIKV